jgi:hypothetical protein
MFLGRTLFAGFSWLTGFARRARFTRCARFLRPWLRAFGRHNGARGYHRQRVDDAWRAIARFRQVVAWRGCIGTIATTASAAATAAAALAHFAALFARGSRDRSDSRDVRSVGDQCRFTARLAWRLARFTRRTTPVAPGFTLWLAIALLRCWPCALGPLLVSIIAALFPALLISLISVTTTTIAAVAGVALAAFAASLAAPLISPLTAFAVTAVAAARIATAIPRLVAAAVIAAVLASGRGGRGHGRFGLGAEPAHHAREPRTTTGGRRCIGTIGFGR